nr:hypothetical protein HEP87_54060 [Streptomyces sp. S1D4-11]
MAGTVLARGAEYRSGQGANQAVAAARHGAPPRLAACVGDDPDGHAVVTALRKGGVDVGLVGVTGEPTGLAGDMVDDAGENSTRTATAGPPSHRPSNAMVCRWPGHDPWASPRDNRLPARAPPPTPGSLSGRTAARHGGGKYVRWPA